VLLAGSIAKLKKCGLNELIDGTLLLGQIQTNQACGISELLGRNLNSLSTLRISAWIV
jgi:hypothetical protein